MLCKTRYILWIGVLLGACDVTQDGGEYGHHLGFYQELEIMKKRRKLEIVNASHVKYDIIKHFNLLLLCTIKQFVLFSPKKAKNTQFYPKMA